MVRKPALALIIVVWVSVIAAAAPEVLLVKVAVKGGSELHSLSDSR